MRSAKGHTEKAFAGGWILVFLISVHSPASALDYPAKPITIYCGYAAGASHDIATRALASGAEKLLGVPIIV